MDRARSPISVRDRRSVRLMMGSSPTIEVLGRPQRRRFRVWQRCMDASRFVLLDEIGTAINMTHRYGKPPREQRVADVVAHGYWRPPPSWWACVKTDATGCPIPMG